MKILLYLGCLLLPGVASAQESSLVLKGARIYAVSNLPIDNGIIILQGGKIQAIGGADLPIPDGAKVVDCSGRTITPGLIDAGTTLSIEQSDANEQANEITPHMRVQDAINTEHKSFRMLRQHGVTAVQINPGNRNVIGGLGAVLKTHGASADDMLLREASALRITLGSEPSNGNRPIRFGTPQGIYYRRPGTRMGVVWSLRKAFYDALDYRHRKTVPGPEKEPQSDPGKEVLLRVLDGEQSVHTVARGEQDLRTALRIAKEFGFQTVLEDAVEAHRVVDEIVDAQAKIIFAPPSLNGADNPDGAEGRYHTLNMLAEHGVPFAIKTNSGLGTRQLGQEAMVAMRNGLSFDKTLAAVTIVPAQILGIDDRLGSLDRGKDADLVVWSGQPFSPTAKAEQVFINGQDISQQ